MDRYTTVRRETPSENLTGRTPYVLASNMNLGAHILERVSDGRKFLLMDVDATVTPARVWADGELARRRNELPELFW